jgi:hypothetical protein
LTLPFKSGDVAVQQPVVRKVDLLLATLAEEAPYLVASADEGGRLLLVTNRSR